MGKIAFVFSGQGAQYSGMGRDLYDRIPASREIFDRADAIRPGTPRQCFSGTDEELAQTKNTQPCMFAMELAAAAAAAAEGIEPFAVAGFSLGEISALAFSGIVSFEEGFRLACLRGELMQSDAEKTDSVMAAVIKLESDAVDRLCGRFEHVYPANYNSPGQTSVSGLRSEIEEFCRAVKAAGGRAVMLRVRGGFHSPFMDVSSRKFGEALKNVRFETPRMAIYSNYTGLPYGDNFTELLSLQMRGPVRWRETVTHMIGSGIDTFIEMGPGNTLCGLIGKTDASVRTLNVEDSRSLNMSVGEVKGC